MDAQWLRGDQALAVGAVKAGVGLVSGYPGSPATGVLDHLLAIAAPGEIAIHWAANEKVAMEEAIGASMAGKRALVVLKSVGLNIGLDPLATFVYTGCHGSFWAMIRAHGARRTNRIRAGWPERLRCQSLSRFRWLWQAR